MIRAETIPPECEITRELEYNNCRACKQMCVLKEGIISSWEKYANDKWYKEMRREIDDVLEAR